MLTTKELAWAAGFLEGEGWFGDMKRKGIGYPAIVAVQVQREPLERLMSYFHGSIVAVKRRSEKHSQAYKWALAGLDGVGLMMTLYPLMSPKRQNRIKEVLGFWRLARPTASARTHCPNGHLHTGQRNARGRRICRICMTYQNKQYQYRLGRAKTFQEVMS